MRALVATGDQTRPLELQDVPEPTPGPDEVVIEVRSISVNRGELRLLASRAAGWRPGQDIAGVVVQAAAQGGGPTLDERVVALVDQQGWAERVAVPASRVAPLPDSVSFASAATLPVAGLTALRALRLGGLLLGKQVLITGASGGVGHFAVQLAKAAGATVTGVRSAADVPPHTGPFHLILESVGGASLTAAIKLAAPDGIIALFGNSSNEESTVSFASFGGRPRARLYGFFVYESGEPPTFGADLGVLAAEIAAGRLRPQIGMEGSWREPLAALEALRSRQIDGKAVLTID